MKEISQKAGSHQFASSEFSGWACALAIPSRHRQ